MFCSIRYIKATCSCVAEQIIIQYSIVYVNIRNEQYQEELWDISCKLLKEWMSPEIWDKYGPSQQTNNDINDGQHTNKDQLLKQEITHDEEED